VAGEADLDGEVTLAVGGSNCEGGERLERQSGVGGRARSDESGRQGVDGSRVEGLSN
jgi:hypothetical protein